MGIKGETVSSIPNELDYKKLYNLCKAHSMSVVVFNALYGVKEKVLPSFLDALLKIVRRHVKKDVQKDHDVNELLSAFEENGLRYMPLKGYYLRKLYPSTDMRYSADFDILIDLKELKKVREVAYKLGLKTERHDEHHDIVYNPETKTVFELHKTIFVGELEKYFGGGEKGFEKAKLKEGYNYFYEMDKETFYISVLAHSAYHFALDAGVGIRHLTDIYLYQKAYALDKEYLNAELEKCGLIKFNEEFEKLANYFFEDEKPTDFTKKLAKHVLESTLLANEEKQMASLVVSNAKGEEGEKKAKKRSFLRAIFPIKEHMQFSYPVLKKHGYLLPIFYVIRWFHVLFTRPRNVGKLKKMQNVSTLEIEYIKEIRNGLGIQDL